MWSLKNNELSYGGASEDSEENQKRISQKRAHMQNSNCLPQNDQDAAFIVS
jgi:hypothetical protein